LKLKYRDHDRARERREGKNNVDYYDSQDTKHVDEEMSKSLGGDEEHTHLVKGLDKKIHRALRLPRINITLRKSKSGCE